MANFHRCGIAHNYITKRIFDGGGRIFYVLVDANIFNVLIRTLFYILDLMIMVDIRFNINIYLKNKLYLPKSICEFLCIGNPNVLLLNRNKFSCAVSFW